MSKMILLFFVLIFSVAGLAKDVHVMVRGMVCGFCTQGISKKFLSEPVIRQVDVNLDKQLVTLSLKDGQTLSDERINDLVRDAGFTPVKISRQ